MDSLCSGIVVSVKTYASKIVSLVMVASFMLMASPSYAQYGKPTERYYHDKERGWFWREDPEFAEVFEPDPEPEPQPVVIAPASSPEAEKIPKFTAEWLKVNLPKALNSAIDNPTSDNVAFYLYLQRIAMDKASRYAEMVELVTAEDPILSEMDRRPNASFAAKETDVLAQRNTEKLMRSISGQTVLWFFYASDCPYCHKSIPILTALQNTYGFNIRAISLDGKPLLGSGFERDYITNQGQAQKLGVTSTPTMVLVKPGERPDIIQISNGAISLSEFTKRTALLARKQGWIGKESYEDTLPVKPRYVDKALAEVINDNDIENPDIAVKKIRDYMQRELNR